MIILRQREFGRTGLNKDQVKQFFKNGQGKINKAAKRNYEAGIGNKVAKHLIKTEKTIPEHKNGKSAAIYFGRQHEHQTDTPNLIDSIKKGVVKLKGDSSSIDHKVNIRGFENTNHLWNRPWDFGDDGRKTSIYLIKKHTDSSINHKLNDKMKVLHQKQFSSQNLISEIKKEFPKFIMSPTSDKFFKKAGEFKIICGDLYVLDSEGIIGLNKILTEITGEDGSERLIIAAVGELEMLACIESKTGKTTVWQRVGSNSCGDSFKCILAVNSPEEFFDIYSDYLKTKSSKIKKETKPPVNPNIRRKILRGIGIGLLGTVLGIATLGFLGSLLDK